MEQHRTYKDYADEQFSKLADHDHELFEDVVNGLMELGWLTNGAGRTSAILSKDDSTIKVFRSAEQPEILVIRFSAPPEESNE